MTGNSALARLVRAGLITGIVDALFSSALSVFAYGSTATRLWQGVASTVLGRQALEGGTAMAAVGLLMHFGVAFAWSAVFLLLYLKSTVIRRSVASWAGTIAVASVYGPIVWMVMSFVVIQLLTDRPPTINFRWWVQFFGHIPFVALPIVLSVRRPVKA